MAPSVSRAIRPMHPLAQLATTQKKEANASVQQRRRHQKAGDCVKGEMKKSSRADDWPRPRKCKSESLQVKGVLEIVVTLLGFKYFYI